MKSNLATHSEVLQAFLLRHESFGGWREEWLGVPLEFRTCLARELPPLEFVGSVRAIVLRANEVLLVHSSVPILCVGGRREPGETMEQTLLREVGEETGWHVWPLGVIGFTHCRHLDSQRPDWGRPAPDFIEPLFAVAAHTFDETQLEPDATPSEFISVDELDHWGIEQLNRRFLGVALELRNTHEAG